MNYHLILLILSHQFLGNLLSSAYYFQQSLFEGWLKQFLSKMIIMMYVLMFWNYKQVVKKYRDARKWRHEQNWRHHLNMRLYLSVLTQRCSLQQQSKMITKIFLLLLTNLICKSAIFPLGPTSGTRSYTFTNKPSQPSTSTTSIYSAPTTNYYNNQYNYPLSNSVSRSNLASNSNSNVNSVNSASSQNIANSYNNQNAYQNIKELFDQIMRTRGMYLANTDYTNPSSLNYRLSVFSENLKKINLHNAQPGVTYKMKANRFTALTSQQFKANSLTNSEAVPAQIIVPPIFASFSSLDMDIVQNIDWKGSGKLTPVKDQGKCGACWAFSAIATIQSYISIQRGTIPQSLSEQQLIDCAFVGAYGASPCGGAWPEVAYYHVNQSGIATTRQYPYKGAYQSCKQSQVITKKHLDPSSVYGTVTGLTNILLYLSRGPLAVAIDASSWQFYSQGILTCPIARQLNHAATLVGFDLGGRFWTLKNSWGPDWGEGGYIRLDGANNCGILSYGYYPFVVPS